MMRARVRQGRLKKIKEHAVREYPFECCGILLGRFGESEILIEEAVEADNVHRGDKRRRYLIDPMRLYEAGVKAESRGLEVVGAYHSHPDKPATPSITDEREALPNFIYLIVSLKGRRVSEVKAWRYVRGEGFERVELSET